MCGICGWFGLRGQVKPKVDTIKKMIEVIKHRGPDGYDYYIDNYISMGFCRLSFIDLSGGMQPICNEDKSIWMTCNGEIFNHVELREKLVKRGHEFRTKTDVEVIIHLYEEYGIGFTKYLNGQFAISLYDSNCETVYLIRDQMGIAPLFYSVYENVLVWGSEIKSVLEYPGVERKINPTAVDQVLNFPGIVASTTFFKNINAIKPGYMLICKKGSDPKEYEYWDICYDVENEDLGERYYIDGIREKLIESIRIRLQADVPIGFYVSGGLDSSVVASFIDKFISHKHSSFSAEVVFGEHNERFFQRLVRNHIQSQHFSIEVHNKDIWEKLPDVIYHTETALRESFDVAAYLLSGLVQTTDVKAVLTGQGADEFFNGYVGYLTDFVRRMNKKNITEEERVINERLWGDPFFRYERNHEEISKMCKKLYSADLRNSYDEFNALKESPIKREKIIGLTSQRRRSYIDAKVRLADHLLGDHGDRMFFAHSIEGRHPFLDINLIEFAMKIPEKYKLNGSNEKYILKKAAEGIVPDEIINRKKYPFSAPGMTYLLKDNPELADIYLNKDIIDKHGIFDYSEVEKLIYQYKQKDFNIEGQYHLDYLQVIMTTSMLCDKFCLTL